MKFFSTFSRCFPFAAAQQKAGRSVQDSRLSLSRARLRITGRPYAQHSVSPQASNAQHPQNKQKAQAEMQLLVVTACLLLVVKMSEGAVAVGVGRLNPGENPSNFQLDSYEW